MVVMGKIVAAHGIQGWVKIQPFTEYLDSLNDYDHWWLGAEKSPWREFELLDCAVHGKVLVARLAGCDDRNASEKLKGLLVAVPRKDLPEADEGEYYWSDLIGLRVLNLAGDELGVVDSLLETGANDVLVLKSGSGELLIPFIKQVVDKVDLAEKVIRVDWQADY
ncbi:MAG: ribosome maturation factor RimM [Nitrosomonadales bacterium]|nr:ribosome maturation factor RimM [Nitrosomonadales bacterium]